MLGIGGDGLQHLGSHVEQAYMKKVYESAIPAEAFARAVAYAISQPDEVDINEIVFRPTSQDF